MHKLNSRDYEAEHTYIQIEQCLSDSKFEFQTSLVSCVQARARAFPIASCAIIHSNQQVTHTLTSKKAHIFFPTLAAANCPRH